MNSNTTTRCAPQLGAARHRGTRTLIFDLRTRHVPTRCRTRRSNWSHGVAGVERSSLGVLRLSLRLRTRTLHLPAARAVSVSVSAESTCCKDMPFRVTWAAEGAVIATALAVDLPAVGTYGLLLNTIKVR